MHSECYFYSLLLRTREFISTRTNFSLRHHINKENTFIKMDKRIHNIWNLKNILEQHHSREFHIYRKSRKKGIFSKELQNHHFASVFCLKALAVVWFLGELAQLTKLIRKQFKKKKWIQKTYREQDTTSPTCSSVRWAFCIVEVCLSYMKADP